MTLGSGPTQMQETQAIAQRKRKEQLERWRESDTMRETDEIRNRPKRVKFADRCIFQAACASNDKAQVARMIQDGYDINAVDEDGITALHQACIEDNYEMVEFLLANGADLNISDNEGWTALHAVATCCYVSIAKLLLENGANVVALNNDCSIPLDICKSDAIRDMFIQEINGKGIDINEARRGEEIKMLEDAQRWVESGRYDEKADPRTGATALHVAACKGYIKVLALIIKAGADVNVRDFDGWTPLHAAAHWGQKEAAEVLLENMCDISIKDTCDQTALDVADPSVLPLLENYKKKQDVNKNIDNAKKSSNVLPLPPKKKTQRTEEENSINNNQVGQQSKTHDTASGSDGELEATEASDTVGALPGSEASSSSTSGSNVDPPSTRLPSSGLSSDSNNIQSTIGARIAESRAEKEAEGSGSSRTVNTSSTTSSGELHSTAGATSKSLPATTSSSQLGTPSSLSSSLTNISSKNEETTSSSQNGDENTPSWRRSGSLRTRNATSQLEEPRTNERVTVRRTRSEATADITNRRAKLQESDAKFYARLTDAKNRIRAFELARAAENYPSVGISSAVSLSGVTTNYTNTLSTSASTSASTNLVNSSSGNEVSSSVSQSGGLDSSHNYTKSSSNSTANSSLVSQLDQQVILRRKDKEADSSRVPRPNTIGSSSVPSDRSSSSLPVNSNDVKVRSGTAELLSPGSQQQQQQLMGPGGGARISPVSKFKQFLFKSFVPPARDEESETQRKAHAKRVRETRRSTQGVTLEELKSAEQYVKNSHQAPTTVASNHQPVGASVSVPASVSTVLRKEDDSFERRPSWRLRVDDQDRSKFSLEDTRKSNLNTSSSHGGSSASLVGDTRRAIRNANRVEEMLQAKPPKPPEDGDSSMPVEDEKEMKNSGAQGAILRKKKPKRRSTGVVQYNSDGSDHGGAETVQSDIEMGTGRGSGFSSDAELGPETSRSENGVSSKINYRKLYEEVLKENQGLKGRLSHAEESIADMKAKLEKITLTPRIGVDDIEKREKLALERKLSEMEEELKESRHLRMENQKLRDENGALIRVISKLSK